MIFQQNFFTQLLLHIFVVSDLVQSCTEIRDSQLISYKTNRQAYIVETEVVVPIVLDLVQEYIICGKRYKSNTLAALFNSAFDQQQPNNDLETKDANHTRQKRLAPLIPLLAVVGTGLATAAWAGYTYASINGKIDELRDNTKHETDYLRQVLAEDRQKNTQTFLAIRREFAHMSAASRETTCNVQTNISMFIYEHYFYQEFDDIINSLRNERLTSSIIPPNQMLSLVRALPILQDTIYIESPYMLYFTGKITFNLAETSGDILRGVLVLPIIRHRRNILLMAAIRKIDSELTVFKPVYITDPGQQSVQQCQIELDTYFCSEADLQQIKLSRLDVPILYTDGMVLLNTHARAEIKDKNDTLRTIEGPAICTTEETSTVIYENRILYTKTSAFHVKHQTILFDVVPFPVTLDVALDMPELFSCMKTGEFTCTKWHGAHTVILVITAVAMIFFVYRNIKTCKVAGEKLQSQPLQEILVPEELHPRRKGVLDADV